MESRRIISSGCTFEHLTKVFSNSDTFFVSLPTISIADIKKNSKNNKITKICEFVSYLSSLGRNQNLVFFGTMYIMPYIYNTINEKYNFQNLISIRTSTIKKTNFLPNEHRGLIFFSTKSGKTLNHVKKPYLFCKCCNRTVKDYGGKKHLLDKEGTRISDVWTDITVKSEEKFPKKMLERISELTRNSKKEKINCISLEFKTLEKWKIPNLSPNLRSKIKPSEITVKSRMGSSKKNLILNEDVIQGLQKIRDKSIDLVLVDPPYNISIKYGKFSDNMKDEDYLQWSKKWISEVSRTLKPGRLLIFVNIPKWSLKLFPYLQTKLTFQGWITWDAFSYPHTPVIPANYPILCFSKGSTVSKHKKQNKKTNDGILNPLNYGYCIRSSCLSKRTNQMKEDKRILSDLWTDIHRIRHNSFRFNHPTLMPQKLAKRIILLFSSPNDNILDCFNGVGTTTLIAATQKRHFIGIEKNSKYYKTSIERHSMLNKGLNPFDKSQGKSTSKNKGYPIIKHQSKIPKKNLQLEVKNVARKLGYCPTPKELKKYGKYPLKYYYANFRDWAEITVATRRTGLNMKI